MDLGISSGGLLGGWSVPWTMTFSTLRIFWPGGISGEGCVGVIAANLCLLSECLPENKIPPDPSARDVEREDSLFLGEFLLGGTGVVRVFLSFLLSFIVFFLFLVSPLLILCSLFTTMELPGSDLFLFVHGRVRNFL